MPTHPFDSNDWFVPWDSPREKYEESQQIYSPLLIRGNDQ